MAKETECAKVLENEEIKIYNRKKRKNIILNDKEQLSTEKKLENEIEKVEKIEVDKKKKKKKKKKKIGGKYEAQPKPTEEIKRNVQNIQISPGRKRFI